MPYYWPGVWIYLILILILWGSKLSWMWNHWAYPQSEYTVHFYAFWCAAFFLALGIGTAFAWPLTSAILIGIYLDRRNKRKIANQEEKRKEEARLQAEAERIVYGGPTRRSKQ